LESSLKNACILKIQNFEGPFDLLFHLLEKNKIDIYDIPINEITDQYMEYLYAMQQLDLEITSEFLVMAATLLHIKSKGLLPEKKKNEEAVEEEKDPREELVKKLVEYRKYKDICETFKEREIEWQKVFYKLPEVINIKPEPQLIRMEPEELRNVYTALLEKASKRINNNNTVKMAQIIQHEKISLKSKMKEIIKSLYNKICIKFSEIFSLKKKSRAEVVTGFMAMLELSKMNKIRIEQKRLFSDIMIYNNDHDYGSNLKIHDEEIDAMPDKLVL